jgi:hypothetical protein
MKISMNSFFEIIPDRILAGIELDGAAIRPKLVPAVKPSVQNGKRYLNS